MKRFFASALCLLMLFSLAAPLCALATTAGWYVVNNDRGYCYLYSKPSSRGSVSRNLGRYDNGEYVYVVEHNDGDAFCRVQTQDDKTGYMAADSLTRYYGNVWTNTSPGWYVVDSDSGYCYLYSNPTSMDDKSRNLGRYNNGEYVYVVDYFGGNDYCSVQTQDGKTGYIHSDLLTIYNGNVWEETSAGWYVVQSKSPNGYCYLYSKPSSRNGEGRNLGRYDNGEYVYVLEYYGGNGFCHVQTTDGKTGYIGASALKRFTGETEANAGWYKVMSYEPYGYCYLYSAASNRDEKSRNLGRYNNGEYVYVLEYYGGQDYQSNFCYVRTQDGKYGFIHDSVLVRP